MLKSVLKGSFFLPGPTEVDDEVLQAQTRPMIGHRGKPMEQLMERIQRNLRPVFRTQRPVYISAASATGLMEASIRNGVISKVLCLVNGAFSERYFKIAQACGVTAVPLQVKMGEYHSPDMLRDALAQDDFDAVTVVHSETSTGVLNPIEELAQVVHEREDRMILVDSVSGLAGARVETDSWALDFVLTGSQKAFALPPGLAFGVAQPALLERARRIPHRGIYFDILELEKFIQKNNTPNTPAVSLLYALDVQLERMAVETIEARWERHTAMAKRMWSWVDELRGDGIDIGCLAPEGYRSPTVTCVTLPTGGKTGSMIAREMEGREFTVSTGYGTLKDSTFRIGHMGDHTVEDLNAMLEVLAAVLRS